MIWMRKVSGTSACTIASLTAGCPPSSSMTLPVPTRASGTPCRGSRARWRSFSLTSEFPSTWMFSDGQDRREAEDQHQRNNQGGDNRGADDPAFARAQPRIGRQVQDIGPAGTLGLGGHQLPRRARNSASDWALPCSVTSPAPIVMTTSPGLAHAATTDAAWPMETRSAGGVQFLGDKFAGHARDRGFAGGVDLEHVCGVGQRQRLAELAVELVGAAEQVRLEEHVDGAGSRDGAGSTQGRQGTSVGWWA